MSETPEDLKPGPDEEDGSILGLEGEKVFRSEEEDDDEPEGTAV